MAKNKDGHREAKERESPVDHEADDDEQRRREKKERKRKRKEEKKKVKKESKRLKRTDTNDADSGSAADEAQSSSPPQYQSGGESTAQQDDRQASKAEMKTTTTKRISDDQHDGERKSSKKSKKESKKKKKKHKSSKSTSDADDSDRDHDGVATTSKSKSMATASDNGGAAPRSIPRATQTQLLDAQHAAESKALTGQDNGRIVASSAIEFYDEQIKKQRLLGETKPQDQNNITLLLFYQYVEPIWDEATYHFMLKTLQQVGTRLGLTGRMRVAKEGLNCTLTATHAAIVEYCTTLRKLRPTEFDATEFKLTNDLPLAQKFPNLKVFKVVELVHYGLEGSKAPPIAKFQGTHLEPKDYHAKLAEPNTVIIDVRNHYEAAIGRFVPPNSKEATLSLETRDTNGPLWLDPKMRKSTEFPVWLDKPETKEMMKGKQVLMYCTGGIRCERASALLKYKMETDPEIKELGIQGVYQLQGGIDKYFKEFPDGGYWQGKNYVFDKRFAHAPPKVDGELHGKAVDDEDTKKKGEVTVMGKCEACHKPWDMYRGKRRCPTCGVPSLICRDCFLADKEGRKKLGKQVRCDLCVEQGITSKRELRQRDQEEIEEYERKMAQRGLLQPEEGDRKAPNPNQVTRLQLKNMCRKNMDEATLMETLPGITHIVWRSDRVSGKFLGQGWVEMATPDDAARAVARDGKIKLFGRPLYISFQPPDGKDAWPPPNSSVDPNLFRK